MTNLSSPQLSALTAILLNEEPRRAAKKEIALTRLVAAAEGHGLQNIEALLAGSFEDAKAAVEAHAAKLIEETTERPGDQFEQELALSDVTAALEAQAEAGTKPRRRKPVAAALETSEGETGWWEQTDNGPVFHRVVELGIKLTSERFGTYAVTHDGMVPQGSATYDAERAIAEAHKLATAEPGKYRLADTIADEPVAVETPAPKPAGAKPARKPAAPRPADDGKPWFRDGQQAMDRMFDVMVEVGPAKLAAFRTKFAQGQDQQAEFEALTQTQQNGILIRAMDRLMADGKLTRDGLIYGVKPELANKAAA